MDKSIPAKAALLLDFIRQTEVGTTARKGYDVISSFKQGELPQPITSMKIRQVQYWQPRYAKQFGAASSATGAYQFMRTTLAGLVKELDLNSSQIFDPDLQDRLAYHLLKRRGYTEFVNGRLSREEFAKNLAKEWASFPVIAATQGAHRRIKRGQSYYAGDGLNKALVDASDIERLLDMVEALDNVPVHDAAPKTEKKSGGWTGPVVGVGVAAFFGAILTIGGDIVEWIKGLF